MLVSSFSTFLGALLYPNSQDHKHSHTKIVQGSASMCRTERLLVLVLGFWSSVHQLDMSEIAPQKW